MLNATVTNATTAPRLQNIETLNITGRFATSGIDLASTTGTNNLNVDTGIQSGTATITNAASLNAKSINIGGNVNTVSVTATASGTRDPVSVNVGNAQSISVNGGAGTDDFIINGVTTGATITLGLNGGTVDIDTYTINENGGKVTIAGDAAAKTVTLNNTGSELTATLKSGQTVVGTAAKSTWDIRGSAPVTLVVKDNGGGGGATTITEINGYELKNSGSSKVTVQVEDTSFTTLVDATDFIPDVLSLTKTGAAANVLDYNENTTLNLAGDATNTGLTINIGNYKDGTYTKGEGTAVVSISEAQTTGPLTTGAGVGTLLMYAQADKSTDTDTDSNGTAETALTVASVVLDAKTTTLALTGAENLTLTKVKLGAASVISGATMTGKLVITDTDGAFDPTIILGSGNDTVSGTNNRAAMIYGNGGNDSITSGSANDTIYGGAGNDTIAGGTGTNTIDAGEGDDSVVVTGTTDTVTLGAGKDTVRGAISANYTVSDFNAKEDTIIVTGSATKAIDLSAVTPTSGAYDLEGGTTAEFTLTGSTVTDLRSFVQLGTAKAAFTAKDGTAVVSGDKSDYINVATTTSATITTGGGSDVVVLNAGAKSAVTINDFTVGTDKIIFTGTATVDEAINLKSITPTTGAYLVDSKLGTVTLKSGGSALTTTDISGIVQLGVSETDPYVLGVPTKDAAIRGSQFSDFITLTNGKAITYSFDNNGGVDTLKSFTTTVDKLSFDDLTGITAATGTDVSALTTKVADAVSGAVYVFGNATSAQLGAKVTKLEATTTNIANGYTQAVINADVANFLEANLTESNGEKYVVVMNDGTDSFAFLVTGDADGVINADQVSLIGVMRAAIVVVGDIA